MSLYRKYRPQKFMDLVGQEHIKTTLTNALKSQKFGQAYLFAGPKGSGKTTTARLLAKALNCTGRSLTKDFEPCDNCQSCLDVVGGKSLDVIEIDAASNRGIDEIRELRDKIRFAPTTSFYKIYVIDECHMLTKEAFNALLKTLEEPPKHAIFVLATTELHKVPATILSRVQTFDFKKAKVEEIIKVLKKISQAEGLEVETEALQLIARLAYGAFRDAVTMLDQIANLSEKNKITLAHAQLALGQSTEESVWDLVEALANKDRAHSLKLVSKVYEEGKNLESFVGQVVELLRKVILTQNNIDFSFELTKAEEDKIKKLAEKMSGEDLVLAIEKLTEVLPKVKASILGQLPLEMIFFELTQANMEKKTVTEESKTVQEIVKEAESVDKKNKSLESDPVIQVKKPEPQPEETVEKVNTDLSADLIGFWEEVVKQTKKHNHGLAAMLKDASISNVIDDKITLAVKFKFHADQICSPKNRQIIEETIQRHAGKNYQIDCILNPSLKMAKPVDQEEELLNSAKEIFDLE